MNPRDPMDLLPATPACQALVDVQFPGKSGMMVSGVKMFARIADALNDAPEHSTEPYRILIKNGRYYEKLVVDKPFIALVGQDRAQTILTFDDASDTRKPDGTLYGTSGSPSVTVRATDFRAENLTFENGFDYDANAAKPAGDPTRFANTQAVALKTAQPSDRAVFRNVAFLGYQDTLFISAGRHYFSQCLICGHVDFIFGAGQAVFEDCDIVSRERANSTNNGYITAASTPLSQPFGFLFIRSRLKKEHPAMADSSVALGRPWHPTTDWPDGTRSADPNAVGAVTFFDCWMDAHISAKGWATMNGRDKDGHPITFLPEDARFFEYGSTGPGGIKSATRRVLSEDEAKRYTVENVLDGWKPQH